MNESVNYLRNNSNDYLNNSIGLFYFTSSNPHLIQKFRLKEAFISFSKKKKFFKELGFRITPENPQINIDTDTEQTVIEKVKECDQNPLVVSILVLLPIPEGFDRIVGFLSAQKDIDSVKPHNEVFISPATSAAICRIAFHEFEVIKGTGIMREIQAKQIIPKEQLILIEKEDDLSHIKEAKIVIGVTNNYDVISEEFLNPNLIIFIDSTYVKLDSEEVRSCLTMEAKLIPKIITPVPGGLDPLERVILQARALQSLPKIKSIGNIPHSNQRKKLI